MHISLISILAFCVLGYLHCSDATPFWRDWKCPSNHASQ